MIAAIYARKSTEQNGVADEEKSVTRQIDHAHAYAVRKGWTVADDHVYIDDGISGAEFAKRPGFLRLMNALKPRAPFQALIMSEVSRLGREQIETAYALKQLAVAGVRCFNYLEDRELLLESATDKFLLGAVTFAADLEREKARQRTHDAMSRKARAGHVTGGSVFGYDNARMDGGGVQRVINNEQAAVVCRIFELAAEGRGITTIAKTLNADRACCPRPQQDRPAGWAPSSVREILRRPLYRDEVVWNQSRKRDRWGAKDRQPRPAHEWIRIPVPHLAIVSEALWTAAHEQMERQRERYSRTSAHGGPPWSIEPRYLLTGLMQCSKCGGGLEARSRSHGRKRKVFYGCASYHRRGRAVCDNRLVVSMEIADNAVIASVEKDLLDFRVLDAAVQRAANELTRIRTGDSREAVQRDLAVLDQQIASLTAAIADGGKLPPLLAALQSRMNTQRGLLHQLKSARQAVSFDVEFIRADLRGRVSDWRTLLKENVGKARGVLKLLIVGRLEMTPDRETGMYRFTGTGTLTPVLAGLYPAHCSVPQSVASLTFASWNQMTGWLRAIDSLRRAA